MNAVLVTGGAGYIGSHMVQALLRAGYRTLILDTLAEGHRAAVRQEELIEIDVGDKGAVRAAIRRHRPFAVLHFAAFCSVGESMENPIKYYRNNVLGTMNLLEAALEVGIPRFIFSSTAAVYGEPREIPITESQTPAPINPYGWTKLIGEQMLADAARAHGIRFVSFRYFNAAGADPESGLGEDHRPENHLIPRAIRAALSEGAEELEVFGSDYPTRDGSCVRDYIHVLDLVDAHLRGLQHLEADGESAVLNLGTESGTSVLEIIRAVEKVTGFKVPHRIGPRRPGDPAVLIASSERAKNLLGWEPRRDLETIVETAYDFMRRHPEGYAEPEVEPSGYGPMPKKETDPEHSH